MSAALSTQQKQCGLDYSECTEEVRVKQGANIGLARFLNRANQSVTGVVEDNVQLAEMRVGLLNGRGRLVGNPSHRAPMEVRHAVTFLKIGNSRQLAGGRRDLSLRLSAASAQMRPKPREAPVMNHTFPVI